MIPGLIGDKIGYRTILILEMLVAGAASTYFAFVPPYEDQTRLNYVTLLKDTGEDLPAVVSSVQWPVEPCWLEPTVDDCVRFGAKQEKN